MPVEERTRAEVDRRLERLAEGFGPFPVREEMVTNDPDFYAHGVEMVRDGWIGDAGAWVIDEANRALLIRHEAGPDRWGVPGGGHEPGETMAETARREVREETGLDPDLTGVSFAIRKTVVLESDPSERFQMLTAIFEGKFGDRGHDEAIVIDDDEVLEARWFSPSDPPPVHEFLEETAETWLEGS